MSWNQWHSDQSSWPSWGQNWSSQSGWQAPSTPPKKPSKEHVEDGPEGSAKSNLRLPASFNPAKEFDETQEVFGLTIPRKIQASAWATKHGLAGRNLEEIRLHELTWQGWSNHNLRALTQGRYVSINFARSINEATFISYLLQHVREHKLDLDQVAECFCVDSGIQVSSSTPASSKKTFRMKELAQWVVKQLQPYQTAEPADAQDRIKELKRRLAQQRKRTHDEAEIGAEPIEGSQPSESSQPDGTPSSQRVRLPFKSNPLQAKPSKGKGKQTISSQETTSQEDPRTLTEKAFDPEFVPKVLSSNAPPTASAQDITKWIAKLRLTDELQAQLQQSCKVAAASEVVYRRGNPHFASMCC